MYIYLTIWYNDKVHTKQKEYRAITVGEYIDWIPPLRILTTDRKASRGRGQMESGDVPLNGIAQNNDNHATPCLFLWNKCTGFCFNGDVHHWASLKRKCLHFDEIFITGCTESCQNDNFQCSQWWKFHQNDDIFVSVLYVDINSGVGGEHARIGKKAIWTRGITFIATIYTV